MRSRALLLIGFGYTCTRHMVFFYSSSDDAVDSNSACVLRGWREPPPPPLLVGELRTNVGELRTLDSSIITYRCHGLPAIIIPWWRERGGEEERRENVSTNGDPRKTSPGICLISSYGVRFSHPRTRDGCLLPPSTAKRRSNVDTRDN